MASPTTTAKRFTAAPFDSGGGLQVAAWATADPGATATAVATLEEGSGGWDLDRVGDRCAPGRIGGWMASPRHGAIVAAKAVDAHSVSAGQAARHPLRASRAGLAYPGNAIDNDLSETPRFFAEHAPEARNGLSEPDEGNTRG